MTGAECAISFRSDSPEETLAIGRRVGRCLSGGLVIALVGPLGAGKTLLTRGIAIGNGLVDPSLVTSPTFTLVQEYSGRLKLYHLDLYRLTSSRELQALGFDEMQTANSVVLMEWGDKWPNVLPEDRITLTLEPIGGSSRLIFVNSSGNLADDFVAALKQSANNVG